MNPPDSLFFSPEGTFVVILHYIAFMLLFSENIKTPKFNTIPIICLKQRKAATLPSAGFGH